MASLEARGTDSLFRTGILRDSLEKTALAGM